MLKSKLITVLKTFSKKECTRFQELVESPFFNKNRKVRLLCRHILKYQPDFLNENLEKRRVHQAVYGQNADFNEYQINNVISDLLQLAHQFLQQQGLAKRPATQHRFLMEALLDRELNKATLRQGKKYKKSQSAAPYRNYDFHLNEYHLHDQLDRQYLTHSSREADPHLQLANDSLDTYYFSNKLRLACGMANRNLVINAAYESTYLSDILRIYEANSAYQNSPSLSVYYKALRMIQEGDNAGFYQEFREDLGKYAELFPPDELFTLYNFALNFCIKKINSGESVYYREILELYQALVTKKINYKNGYLTQWTFKNIVTVGIRQQDYEWTAAFIQDYQNDLLPEERTQAVAYNLAMLYHARGAYREAVLQLHNIEFSDAFYHLGAKAIQLQSYFELAATEAFLSLVKASLQYIRRHRKLSEYHKQSNVNFIKLAKRIYLLKTEGFTLSRKVFGQKMEDLTSDLAALQPVVNKDWLGVQVQKLRKA